ncbi:uncharacterized protein H6S33_009332 [Morchella sextelata]|uniref:uncharacterized protein n=1 Tax=Morchella sextelata TaxID=1174677 RepID=UPI001D03AB96|nr:uncharacterized protein H6S33_009332 [Morchella sextelata]KAH0612952.1 hypothetical protein H6S33_009332 [Morchella sextelata]
MSVHPTHYTTLTHNGITQDFPQKCDCGLYTGASARRHLVHDWEEKLHHMRRKKNRKNDPEYDEFRGLSLNFSQRIALEKIKYEKLGVKFSSINSPPGPHDSSISKSTVFKPGRRIRAIIEDMKMSSQFRQNEKMDWEFAITHPSPIVTPPSSPKPPSNDAKSTETLNRVTITPRVWGPLFPLDYKNEWDLIGYGPRDQQALDKAALSKENRYGDARAITTSFSLIDREI